MSQIDVRNIVWSHKLLDTNQDKSGTLVSVDKEMCWDLVGVNHLQDGGLRTFPGFRFFLTLGTVYGGPTGDLTFVRFVTFRVGEDELRHGFVYRRGTGVYFRQIRVDGTASPAPVLLKAEVSSTAQMDVTVFGRLVYVFVQGESPFVFYLDDTDTYRVVLDPGPGRQPRLLSHDQSFRPFLLPQYQDVGYDAQIILTNRPPSAWGLADRQPDSSVRPLLPGNYAFSYRLYDSRTGRWGNLSTIARAETADFQRYWDPTLTPKQTSEHPERRYAAIEIVYDSEKWDTAYIYRSVQVQAGGGTFAAAVSLLERVLPLRDYRIPDVASGSSTSGWGSGDGPIREGELDRAFYFYELSDEQLVYTAEIYTDRPLFDEQMPRGGAALYYENCMLVSTLKGNERSFNRHIGEIRWSSLVNNTPELFAAEGRYIPSEPTHEVVRFVRAAGNVIGFGTDRLYHIRKETVYIKVQEMHEGMGIVNPNACAAVGSGVYYLTSKGLKFVDTNGQLEDVRIVNQVILEAWSGRLSNVVMAFDPTIGLLVMHNPDVGSGETVLFWLTTSRVSSIVDTSRFRFIETGRFGSEWPWGGFPSGRLESRAFFVTPGGRVYLVDIHESNPHALFMDPALGTDSGIYVVPTAQTNTLSLPVSDSTINFGSSGLTDSYVYVIDDPNPARIGQKARIVGGTTSAIYLSNPMTVSAGALVCISPVYVRIVTRPVVIQAEDGTVMSHKDFSQVKEIHGIQLVVSDVTGPNASPENRWATWRGLAYRANDKTPGASGWPRNRDGERVYGFGPPQDGLVATLAAPDGTDDYGDATAVKGNRGVASTILSPGVEFHVPGIRCRMLGLVARGSVRPYDSVKRGT